MSLRIIKYFIPNTIRGAILKENDAKSFLEQIANYYATNKKVETNTILTKLVSM